MKKRIILLISITVIISMLFTFLVACDGGESRESYSVYFDSNGGTVTSGDPSQNIAPNENAIAPTVERRVYLYRLGRRIYKHKLP